MVTPSLVCDRKLIVNMTFVRLTNHSIPISKFLH